jgi:hypothetical protein
LHNKPTGCSASGAYAPGPEEEEEKKNTSDIFTLVLSLNVVILKTVRVAKKCIGGDMFLICLCNLFFK